jgi:hypothetical protein
MREGGYDERDPYPEAPQDFQSTNQPFSEHKTGLKSFGNVNHINKNADFMGFFSMSAFPFMQY